jgi:hypothetical protein
MNTLATDFLIVVGTPEELEIDLDRLRKRMQAPGVHEDLAAVGLDDPYRLIYTFLASETDLDRYLGQGPLNSDDRPVLSYSTYAANFRATIAGNMAELLACRGDVNRYVRHSGETGLMLRHYAASNEALLGHICFQAGQEKDALQHYVKGAGLLNTDAAFQELVTASIFRAQRMARK